MMTRHRVLRDMSWALARRSILACALMLWVVGGIFATPSITLAGPQEAKVLQKENETLKEAKRTLSDQAAWLRQFLIWCHLRSPPLSTNMMLDAPGIHRIMVSNLRGLIRLSRLCSLPCCTLVFCWMMLRHVPRMEMLNMLSLS